MKGFARAVVVSVLSLLALATSASAECAWVLWQSGVSPEKVGPPVPADSFKSLEECKARASERERSMEEIQKRLGKAVGAIIVRCLPDTIDPRGPKS